MNKKAYNYCYIDGQNLYYGLKGLGWKLDHRKFRIFLRDKYKIEEAYYHIGFFNEKNQDLYDNLQKAGFILRFRTHMSDMVSTKKGNVDTDIVFDIMRLFHEKVSQQNNSKIVLVSSDGDYFKLVEYLIQKERFEKIIFTRRKNTSSLYNRINREYKISVERIKEKIKM